MRFLRKLLYPLVPIVLLSAFQAQTCFSQVPDSVKIDLMIDSTLPAGVAAVTLCNENTGRPIVISKREPDAVTLVHEAVHVMQIERYGGCPKGFDVLTANRLSLIAAEAEAVCVEAYWTLAHGGRDIRKTLNMSLRGLHQLSQERARVKGEHWRLSLGEIAEAFEKACAQPGEPKNVSHFNGHVGPSGRLYSNDSTTGGVRWPEGVRERTAEN